MKLLKRAVLLFALLLLVCCAGMTASAEEAHDITARCKIYLSEGKPSSLTDETLGTRWKPEKKKAKLSIELPADGAGYFLVNWGFEPKGYVFGQYDENQELISEGTESLSYAGMVQVFAIGPETRYVRLTLTEKDQAICDIRLYSSGDLPENIAVWEAPCEKCDLMVVSAHQDDEFIFFGGIIPYYDRVAGLNVQVVYMANCGRMRRGEALDGLWAAGMRHYPDFLYLKDEHLDSVKTSIKDWGGKDNILKLLVERIRRYRPEVILTHDLNGEYGHPQHIITAQAMESAIRAAADPEQYADSRRKYGTWQVKKLYLHLDDADEIAFDWNRPYEQLNGETPLDVARAGFAKHVSQQEFYSVKDGGKYDNSRFGLTYSTVGADAEHLDLFEHIDGYEYLTATPEPTPTFSPTPSPTPEPTPEPTPLPTAQPTAQATAKPDAPLVEQTPPPERAASANAPASSESSTKNGLLAGALAICVAGGIGAWIARERTKTKKMRHRRSGRRSKHTQHR